MADQSIDQRLSSVQDTVEIAARYITQYTDIAAEMLIDNDLANLAAANVAMERAHAVVEAQREHLRNLLSCVDEIIALRRQIKGV